MSTIQDLITRIKLIGTDEFTRGLGDIANKVRETNEQFKRGNLTQKEYTGAIGDLSDMTREYTAETYLQRKMVVGLRTDWRMQNAVLLESMRVFRDIANMGNTIRSIFETWTLMQIRYENQLENVRDAETDVTKIQAIHVRIVREFGDKSFYAQQSLDALQNAEKRLSTETKQLTQIEDQNRWGMVGMAMSAFSLVTELTYFVFHLNMVNRLIALQGGQVIGLGAAWSSLKLTLGAVSAQLGAAGITGALTTIGAAIAPLIAAIAVAGSLYTWMTATPQERAAEQLRLRETGPEEYRQFATLPAGIREEIVSLTINNNIGEIRTDMDYDLFLEKLRRDEWDALRETK